MLIIKIGKTGGPVGSRKNALNLITVLDKQTLRVGSQAYERFKELSLKSLAVLCILLLTISGEHPLTEILSDTYLKTNDLSIEKVDLSPEILDLNRKAGDLNGEFEMGLEIPLIPELDDLNCDIVEISEEVEYAWDKEWIEQSYHSDGEIDVLNTNYGLEIGEISSEKPLNKIEENIRKNRLAQLTNSQLEYDILDIDNNEFIITNLAIFESEWIKMMRDLAVEIKVENTSGYDVTTLTISTEVANLLFKGDLLDSVNYLTPGLQESSEGSQIEYENRIREIRDDTAVLNSPEFKEMFEFIHGNRTLTILNVNPISPLETYSSNNDSPTSAGKSKMEKIKEIDGRNQMIADGRERISIIFSSQNPERQHMPSGFEVPTRPYEPGNIEKGERDNVIRAKGAERLNEGYDQINIITNGLMEDYYSTEGFDKGYQDTQYLIGTYDIFEEEDLGLNRLFEDI